MPDEFFRYIDSLLPIDANKMLCWDVLSARINSHSIQLGAQAHRAANDKMRTLPGDPDKQFIEYVHEHSSDKLLAQLAIAHRYAAHIAANEIKGFEANVDLIGEVVSNPLVYQPLYDSYRRTKEYLDKPLDPSGIVFERFKNIPVAESVGQVLSKNKGKVVCIDCWATWCGPCLKAMPHAEEPMAKAGHKDIVYVFLCVRSDAKVWKKVSSQFKYEQAQHILLDEAQSEFFADTMKVADYPYYFLSDQEGRVAEQGNHLHSGEERTAQRILDLVSKTP